MSTTPTHRVLNETFAGYTQLTTLTCFKCGVMFAIPTEMNNTALRDHSRDFWCPNGHAQRYVGKTEAQRLQESLDRERQRAGRLAAERDQTEARLRAQKGVTTKLKKRVAAGVCPCCKRTFQDLSRHMSGQHPGYVESQDT